VIAVHPQEGSRRALASGGRTVAIEYAAHPDQQRHQHGERHQQRREPSGDRQGCDRQHRDDGAAHLEAAGEPRRVGVDKQINQQQEAAEDRELYRAGIFAAAACAGSPACQLELAILVREVWLDISRQPLQRSSRNRWNRGVLGTGRTTPKEGHVSLEISALHDVAKVFQAIVFDHQMAQ
jgi:hypothetical protein